MNSNAIDVTSKNATGKEEAEFNHSFSNSIIGGKYSGRLYSHLFNEDNLYQYTGETVLFIKNPRDLKKTIVVSINLSSDITGDHLKLLIKKSGNLDCELSQMRLVCVHKEIEDNMMLKEISDIFYGLNFVDYLKQCNSLILEINENAVVEEDIGITTSNSADQPGHVDEGNMDNSRLCITM